MKTENLEALLLDRALGQLAPEMAELVEEYLAQNPCVAARAAALRGTVDLARASVSADAVEAVAAGTSTEGWGSEHRAGRWRTVLEQGWKFAACLALGVAVGWSVRRPDIGTTQMARQEPPPIRARASGGENSAAAFWIAARRVAEKTERTAQPQTVGWEALGVSSAKGGAR